MRQFNERTYSSNMKTNLIFLVGALTLTLVLAVDKPTSDLLAPLSELILPSDSASAGKPSEFSAPQRSAKKTLAAPTQSTKSNVPAVKATEAPRPAPPKAESRSAKEISSKDGNSAISSSRSVGSNGAYQYAYETDTGIQMEEMGELKTVNDVQAMDVVGGYSYTAPDGTIISVKYVADENGFHPTGDHLPVAPPIPEAIQRALLYIQTHPPKGNV